MREIEVVHSLPVQFPREQVWGFLWDIEGIAACIPGCEKAEIREADRKYEVSVVRSISAFRIHMTLQIEVVERTPPACIVLMVTGRDLRLKSEFSQKLEVRIRDEHGSTFIDIHATLGIDGLLSKLSRHLIEMQIKQLLNDFSDNLAAELGRRIASLPSHEQYRPVQ